MTEARKLLDIDTIVIHCSATPNGRSEVPAVDGGASVPIDLAIDEWHRLREFRRPEWGLLLPGGSPILMSIGYHAVIRCDGMVAPGRSWAEAGAHCPGVNRTSLGVCLAGTDRFTPAQWMALRAWVEHAQTKLGRGLRVVGHGEIDISNKPPKACPGFSVRAWLAGGMVPLEGHTL